jgi:hypothetical protein
MQLLVKRLLYWRQQSRTTNDFSSKSFEAAAEAANSPSFESSYKLQPMSS